MKRNAFTMSSISIGTNKPITVNSNILYKQQAKVVHQKPKKTIIKKIGLSKF